jgi:hypothetical protein
MLLHRSLSPALGRRWQNTSGRAKETIDRIAGTDWDLYREQRPAGLQEQSK